MFPRMKKFGALTALALVATGARAMTINANGTGQVLIYPYYTVNKNQQTLFTVNNPTDAAKAVQILFHEGYDGRPVYAADIFLAPRQSWSAVVFALSDLGVTGDGVAIQSNDNACLQPRVHIANTTPNAAYDLFTDLFFTNEQTDGGPTGDAREREGYIELIELAEIQGATEAAVWPDFVTPNCTPLSLPLVDSDFTAPTGGLAGNLAVINVPQGTFFAFEPVAIDGFRFQPTLPTGAVLLDQGGDDTADTVSASINYHGAFVTATYPKSRAIDAVSALFMANLVSGDIDETADIGANTDWVLTFPTKEFYVDTGFNTAGDDFAPFEVYFDDIAGGGSPVTSTLTLYNHDGSVARNVCSFNECPPVPAPVIQYQTQIVTFGAATTPSAVLGSALTTQSPFLFSPVTGELTFSNALGASNEGIVLTGVPVFGVQAINYVNSNVTAGVLSNYSGATHLRTTVSCTRNGGACQ